MKKLLLVSLALSVAFAWTATAADLAIGLRLGHNHPTGGTDWWDDYVSGRHYDQYTWEDDAWVKSGTKARASSAQNDDFSNLNIMPALRGTMRFDKFDLIVFDFEHWKTDDVRIMEAAFRTSKRGPNNWYQMREEVDLSILSLRNMAAWRFDGGNGHFYAGGGIGWHFWTLNSNLVYNEYTAYDSKYKKFEITDTVSYDLDDSGLAIGVSLIAGYEHELTDLMHPFIDIGFEYAVAKWEPDDLGCDPYCRIPSEPPEGGADDHTDQYFVPKFEIQDSYDVNLGGIKVAFGINFMLPT